ncbi:hypothetical protein FACS1894109_17760 [Spirochaetia bacterium]|nr:hypothetical protein FACS1894109_17760 [Spirochaetia bacterium]
MNNTIKARLGEYLGAKGIEINEHGFIKCLDHDDHTPSCQVNADYLYCHVCGWSGDIYAATAALLNVPYDKEHFRDITNDIEKALGLPEWKPAKRKPGEPRVDIKLSQSAVFRSELLKEFARAIDSGDMETAYYKATLLHALFMLPDKAETPAKAEPKKPKGMTVKKRMETWAPKREAWTL